MSKKITCGAPSFGWLAIRLTPGLLLVGSAVGVAACSDGGRPANEAGKIGIARAREPGAQPTVAAGADDMTLGSRNVTAFPAGPAQVPPLTGGERTCGLERQGGDTEMGRLALRAGATDFAARGASAQCLREINSDHAALISLALVTDLVHAGQPCAAQHELHEFLSSEAADAPSAFGNARPLDDWLAEHDSLFLNFVPSVVTRLFDDGAGCPRSADEPESLLTRFRAALNRRNLRRFGRR